MIEPKDGEWWMCEIFSNENNMSTSVIKRERERWYYDDNDERIVSAAYTVSPKFKMVKSGGMENLESDYDRGMREAMKDIAKSCGKTFSVDIGYLELPKLVDSLVNKEKLKPRTKVSCESDWNGEGLPPKGAKVMLDNYEKMSVLYGHEDFGTVVEVVAEIPEERCCVVRLKCMLGIFDESFFRPIETPEQEEERIRKEAISEMVGHAWKDQSTEECMRFAESLYDAGYRKPE